MGEIKMTHSSRILDYNSYIEAAGCDGDPCRAPIWPTPGDVRRSCPWVNGLDPHKIRTHTRYAELGAVTAQRRAAFLLGMPPFDIPWLQPYCPYCRSLVTVPVDVEHAEVLRAIRVVECPGCGWWASRDACELREEDGVERIYFGIRRAVLRSFLVEDVDVPLDLLHKHIVRRHDALLQIHPKRLERLVAAVFADFFDCEARHIGGPGDGGIDLILLDGEHQRVVQVKRRASAARSERVTVVRDFIGAMVVSGAVNGIVVTTAPSFSRAAQQAAERAAASIAIERIELVDGPKFLDICGLVSSVRSPWQRSAHSFDQSPDELMSPLVAEALHAAAATPYAVTMPDITFADVMEHTRGMNEAGL